MIFSERLTQLRKENGYPTRKAFAEKLNMPETTLRNYETGTREPGHAFLIEISNLFNVSVDYLIGRTDEPEILRSFSLKTSEQKMIEQYRALDDTGKDHVTTVIDWETDRIALKENTFAYDDDNLRPLDYYRKLASAGSGQVVFDDTVVERIQIPNKPEYNRVAYAIGVNGNSMEPLYYDSDVLLIEPTTDIGVGEIGIFIVDGEAYVKKMGNGELISINESYENIPLTEYSSCMGRVVGKL